MKKILLEKFIQNKINQSESSLITGGYSTDGQYGTGECTGGGFQVQGPYWRSWTSDETRRSTITGGWWTIYHGLQYGTYG